VDGLDIVVVSGLAEDAAICHKVVVGIVVILPLLLWLICSGLFVNLRQWDITVAEVLVLIMIFVIVKDLKKPVIPTIILHQ
tara:strand:- start:1036 stop:1278 length:243 start_codon:yes stop_codon:yes gene_type:complete